MHSSLLLRTIRNPFFPHHTSTGPYEMLARNDGTSMAKTEIHRLHTCGASQSAGDGVREVLIECAEAISRADWQRAIQELAVLSSKASAQGDSTERVTFYFSNALTFRIMQSVGESLAIQTPMCFPEQPSTEDIQAAYLALNQVTPFVRFAHLTANQAILEALEDEDMAHIVDLDIKQGVQWPPLMQALAERGGSQPRLRISGFGASMEELEQTGMRLAEFASSLDLPFEFNAVVRRIEEVSAADHESLRLEMGEAVAVNCTLQLHRLLHVGIDALSSVLEMIRSLQPKVVAIAEKEASNNHSSLVDRLKEAFTFYSAIFDSLEATLPPNSSERLMIEQVMFGREILNILACEDYDRMERHENFDRWKDLMERTGFLTVAPSSFAVAQAKLLLRLHYPAEGYMLFEHGDSLFLGWQDRPLLAVSSWHGCSNF